MTGVSCLHFARDVRQTVIGSRLESELPRRTSPDGALSFPHLEPRRPLARSRGTADCTGVDMAQLRSSSYMLGTLYAPRRQHSRRSLAGLISEVVYFARTKDNLVKIGHTADLERRVHKIGPWSCLLAFIPGDYDDEQEMHRRFREYRARGYEYYYPASELLDHVDEIRDQMGVP